MATQVPTAKEVYIVVGTVAERGLIRSELSDDLPALVGTAPAKIGCPAT
jgi:hypothetical protein